MGNIILMYRNLAKGLDFLILNRNRIAGLGVGLWLCRRFGNNMTQLEENTKDKKLFDPVKARAQIEIYKEIYRIENEEDKAREEGRELSPEEIQKIYAEKDGALRILQTVLLHRPRCCQNHQ